MKELYEAIEAKIKASGYPRAISGEDVYNDRLTEKRMEVMYCYPSSKMM